MTNTISPRVARDLHCAIARYSQERETVRYTLEDVNDTSEEVRDLSARIARLEERLTGHHLAGVDLVCHLHAPGNCPKPRY